MKFIILLFSLLTFLTARPIEKIEFDFSEERIDVIIPSVEKDLAILEMCIQGIRENGRNIGRVIVIS